MQTSMLNAPAQTTYRYSVPSERPGQAPETHSFSSLGEAKESFLASPLQSTRIEEHLKQFPTSHGVQMAAVRLAEAGKNRWEAMKARCQEVALGVATLATGFSGFGVIAAVMPSFSHAMQAGGMQPGASSAVAFAFGAAAGLAGAVAATPLAARLIDKHEEASGLAWSAGYEKSQAERLTQPQEHVVGWHPVQKATDPQTGQVSVSNSEPPTGFHPFANSGMGMLANFGALPSSTVSSPTFLTSFAGGPGLGHMPLAPAQGNALGGQVGSTVGIHLDQPWLIA